MEKKTEPPGDWEDIVLKEAKFDVIRMKVTDFKEYKNYLCQFSRMSVQQSCQRFSVSKYKISKHIYKTPWRSTLKKSSNDAIF
jgi:hypothetical protein